MYEHHLAEQRGDGSWHSREAGPVCGTAIMTLAFTVPHRQMPIDQRDEIIGEKP